MLREPVRLQPDQDHALTEALARTPADYFVIWDGRPYRSRPGSASDRIFKLICEIWTPVALRTLILQAARAAEAMPSPDRIREAVRVHQAAKPACYYLVRRDRLGAYVAVTDIAWPASGERIRPGQIILGGGGRLSNAAELGKRHCQLWATPHPQE
jgi:hypothetical protein